MKLSHGNKVCGNTDDGKNKLLILFLQEGKLM